LTAAAADRAAAQPDDKESSMTNLDIEVRRLLVREQHDRLRSGAGPRSAPWPELGLGELLLRVIAVLLRQA
jgi:hypothetical protein